jgi:hypothetical protein
MRRVPVATISAGIGQASTLQRIFWFYGGTHQ